MRPRRPGSSISDKLKVELDGLAVRKTALQAELLNIRQEQMEYDTLCQNIDALLILDTESIKENEIDLQ